jgi:hypothetical protein
MKNRMGDTVPSNRSGARFASTLKVCAALLALAVSVPAAAQFTDDFNRANADAIGNGWIEKSPDVFSISGNRAQKNALSSPYLNNLVYRPAGESLLDVEASTEMRVLAASPGYAQIMTRVQTSTVAVSGQLDGYMLYLNDSNSQAILGRQSGSSFVTTLATLTISPALNTTDTFRLRLRSTGTNPVELEAYVERWTGAAWQIAGSAVYSDSSASRFSTAGTVGFGGYIEAAYAFDNFRITNLGGGGGPGNNPVPTLTLMEPASAVAGESGLTLTATGSGFVNGAVVRWNGANRATTFVSATTLEAQITTADLATAGSASVTVFNPAPGGGTSNAQSFTIQSTPTPNPVPGITSLNPNQAPAGSGNTVITVNGSNFASSAVVRVNGASRTTTFVSASQLTATLTAADLATSGNRTITVFNPAPGGGTSGGLTFTVVPGNPVPAITSLSPSSVTAGASAFTLTVDGTSFVNGATVRWNGANRATTFVSATRLTASIGTADVTTAGNASVTVFNPSPGGGTSPAATFTISPSGGGGGGGAIITSLSPVSGAAGGGSVQVTVNGSGFTSGSVIRWNGANRTTTFLSSTQVRATLSSSDMSAAGIGAITVNTPSVGTSEPLSFFILSAGSTVLFDGFNRADSATIGNGWTEKTPSAFGIQGNRVVSAGDTYPFAFRDTIVYRSSTSEDQLDAESGIEFIRGAVANFPQLHQRVQRSSLSLPNVLSSYILFVDDYMSPEAMVIAVQPDMTSGNECSLIGISFPTPLEVGTRYRMRFIVQGSYPVQLTGIMERYTGTNWVVHASGSVTHDNNTQVTDPNLYCPYEDVPPPISNSGTFGFAKWWDPVDVYDNFHWRSLGGTTVTLPSLTSVSPNSVTAGGSSFQLTANGSGFTANSVIRWNGANRTTTFLSSTQLRTTISASDIASSGSASVSVFTSGTGGGSSPQTLTVSITPPPVIGGFTDEFNRPDSDVLGNNWVEKTASAFFLVNGSAAKQAVSTNYTNNLVYRPAAEDVLNVEASTVFRITTGSPGYPQVMTRLQSSTAAATSSFNGYVLFVDDNNARAYVGRQDGTSLPTIAAVDISPALNTTDTFRMRLSTTGTTTVQIQAYVERLTGSGWQIIGQATATDSSAQRISTAGSVGFGGYVEASYVFDSFTRTNLP